MNICEIKDLINEYAQQTGRDGYMDTGDAWKLLTLIRNSADGLCQATDEEIAAAHDQYGSADVQIDGDAMTSASDQDGVWVQAWVYIYPAEEDNDD